MDASLSGVWSAHYEAASLGVARLSRDRAISHREGLALHCQLFDDPDQLGRLLERLHLHGSASVGAYRFWLSGVLSDQQRLVLVVENEDQAVLLRAIQAQSNVLASAELLGVATRDCRTTSDFAQHCVRDLVASCRLAAGMLWVNDAETGVLKLRGQVGIQRSFARVLGELDPQAGVGSLPELVAVSRRSYSSATVQGNELTRSLESKLTYLQPGGVYATPLICDDHLVGVLEVIGRHDDESFEAIAAGVEVLVPQMSGVIVALERLARYERLATHDALTGLGNHRVLHQVLNERVEEARRSHHPVGILMIDVDHFRAFNEEEGHDTGDEVLKATASVIQSCLRTYDLAARYGGEEFTVVLPGSGPEETAATAERIRKAVESMPFTTAGGQPRQITVSIGHTSFMNNGETPAALIKHADTALFEAKHSGRNRCVEYSHHQAHAEDSIERELEHALRWLTDAHRRAGDARVKKLIGLLQALAEEFKLTISQRSILRTLIQVAPQYSEMRNMNGESLDELHKSDGFRVLLPHLLSLTERWDGTGPLRKRGVEIPLLCRLTQCLLAYESGTLDTADHLDPFIVSKLREKRKAA